VLSTEKILSNPSNNGFYLLTDSVYLIFGYAEELNEYGLYDKKMEVMTKKGDYPQWATINVDEPGQMFFTYIKTCAVHPNGKKFASFYGRFKRLRIYDHSANLLHDIDVQTEPYPTNIEEDLSNQPEYYIGQPQAIGNYIYALCSNSKRSQPDAPNACELQVWDWQGNPIACYHLDQNVSLIAISEKYHKMYALDRSIEDQVFIYDIPELNNEMK
jgi:hypothetical protein